MCSLIQKCKLLVGHAKHRTAETSLFLKLLQDARGEKIIGDPNGAVDRTFFIRFQFAGHANGLGDYKIKQVRYSNSATLTPIHPTTLPQWHVAPARVSRQTA